jgi:cytochrome P450
MESEVVDLSTLEPEFSKDPYPIFATLRESGPARRVVLHGLPAWLVTRFEDAERLFTDQRVSNNPQHASEELKQAAPWVFANTAVGLSSMMLQLDPPDHTRLRRLVSSVFTARRVEDLRPRVEEITASLVASFAPRGRVELVSEFAAPLPIKVISELLGVPPPDQEDFRRWSTVVLSGSKEPGVAAEAFGSVHRYLTSLIESKHETALRLAAEAAGGAHASEHPDLLVALAAVRNEVSERLDQSELLSMAFLLLIAGFMTTTHMIGNAVLALLRDPAQLAALRSDPGGIDLAVEELLRYDGPSEITAPRFATEPIALGDTVIGQGDAILIALNSANRDPARFADPDRLDLRRDSSRHLGFGYGLHYCLGAPLARLETSIALKAIVGLDDLALAAEPDELEWAPDAHLRGLRSLPLTFTPNL